MTREEIHKNVLTIRNYYFSIQNKLDNGYKISDNDSCFGKIQIIKS